MKDVRGMPNKPIARQTPLGWICIGFPHDDQLLQQTNFNRTYLTRNDRDLREVDTILRKFWQTENVASIERGPLKAEDHEALEKVKQSLTYENGMYQVAIPCKVKNPSFQIVMKWRGEDFKTPRNV